MDLRIMNPTLSLRRNEAEISIMETVRISIANSFAIFRNSFIEIKEISIHQSPVSKVNSFGLEIVLLFQKEIKVVG